MFHDESWIASYFEVERSNVKVTKHKKALPMWATLLIIAIQKILKATLLKAWERNDRQFCHCPSVLCHIRAMSNIINRLFSF